MKIVTGNLKGRKIEMPRGIRPTQDKVRKAIFDILGDLEGCSFLELYAGSGAVGFEAVSRGAIELVLVEVDPQCQAAIKKNIRHLELLACNLYPVEAISAVKRMHKEGRRFDVIFLDPPYYRELTKKTLHAIGEYDILAAEGIVIAQHFKKENLPDNLGVLSLFRQKKYGDTLLSFYRHAEAGAV